MSAKVEVDQVWEPDWTVIGRSRAFRHQWVIESYQTGVTETRGAEWFIDGRLLYNADGSPAAKPGLEFRLVPLTVGKVGKVFSGDEVAYVGQGMDGLTCIGFTDHSDWKIDQLTAPRPVEGSRLYRFAVFAKVEAP